MVNVLSLGTALSLIPAIILPNGTFIPLVEPNDPFIRYYVRMCGGRAYIVREKLNHEGKVVGSEIMAVVAGTYAVMAPFIVDCKEGGENER
jgi:hypothetical protein